MASAILCLASRSRVGFGVHVEDPAVLFHHIDGSVHLHDQVFAFKFFLNGEVVVEGAGLFVGFLAGPLFAGKDWYYDTVAAVMVFVAQLALDQGVAFGGLGVADVFGGSLALVDRASGG